MTETKKTLTEEMLERHRNRMNEISLMEIDAITQLAASHAESIHNNSQLNVRKREKASKIAEGLLDAINKRVG